MYKTTVVEKVLHTFLSFQLKLLHSYW